jgi:phage tail sheath protein FI
MPIIPTYPGVYVQELPSGVRTITAVSTSVTAFVGSAKRGPVNKAVEVQNFGDFARKFGGLQADSEMSYAVQQFFLNGGTDAWVVRLAKNPQTAQFTLLSSDGSKQVLDVAALDEGSAGNQIEVRVDYQTGKPDVAYASTFNISFNYTSADNPADNASEIYINLSMNSQDVRYVLDMINGVSRLATVKRNAAITQTVLDGLGPGTSTSAPLLAADGATLLDVATLVDATHNQFQVAVNGLAPISVLINPAGLTGAAALDRLKKLCDQTQAAVRLNQTINDLANFTCAVDGTNTWIVMTSGTKGEGSSVRVLSGARNDVSARLKLGAANGGQEVDAVAALRPAEIPDHGTLMSDKFQANDLDTLPSGSKFIFLLSLDGGRPMPVNLSGPTFAGAGLADKLKDAATRIQQRVRALKPSDPAFSAFTCTADTTNNQLLLSSGSRGLGSSVTVTAPSSNSLANELHLLNNTTRTQPPNVNLTGGNESPYTPDEAPSVFLADPASRNGIYALEAVDLFNLLCLPGIKDSGILQEAAAYCASRRAFLIIDAPDPAAKPDAMALTIFGPTLPKSEYAAVYYPWTYVADPLKNGKLRLTAPCGTVAGLYARTDSTRGVWKAPAGTEAVLTGVQGLTYVLTDNENGTLNPHGVNCLRIFPVYGPICWGARTLRGDDQLTSEYKYIPVRRLALFLEESLYRGLKWVVFEPNAEPLWAQIRLNVGAFMQTLFRQGAFKGQSPRDAYFVKCDGTTTTQNDIDLGIVNILVGFAPLKPAEFVILTIQQIAGQVQT